MSPCELRRAAVWFAVCALGLPFAPPSAAEEPSDPPAPAAEERREAGDGVRAALDRRLDFDFVDTPLQDALDFMEAQMGVEMELDRRALDEAGIDADTRLTLKVSGITARSGLSLLLEPHDLTFAVRDELLVVTVPEAWEQSLVLRVHSLAGLVRKERGGWGRWWRGVRDIGESSAETEQETLEGDELLDLITTLIHPHAWDNVGGAASLRIAAGSLIVSADEPTQQLVERFLDRLRQLHEARRAGREAPRVLDLATTSRDDRKFAEALAKRGTLQCMDTPLRDVVSLWADLTGLPILLDQQGLADSGLRPSAPVSAALNNLPLRAIIDRTLRELDLRAVVRHEVLWITTAMEAEHILKTRLYPVADLLEGEDADELIDALLGTVRPDMWDQVGGPGSVQYVSSVEALAVSQNEEVHGGIETFLAMLRKSRKELGKPAAQADGRPTTRLYLLREESGDDRRATHASLLRVIPQLIEPESWKEERYLLEAVGDALVVRHTEPVQRRIEDLLEALELLRPAGSFGGGSAPSSGGVPPVVGSSEEGAPGKVPTGYAIPPSAGGGIF